MKDMFSLFSLLLRRGNGPGQRHLESDDDDKDDDEDDVDKVDDVDELSLISRALRPRPAALLRSKLTVSRDVLTAPAASTMSKNSYQ